MDRNQGHYITKTPQVHKDSCARTWQIDRETSTDINRLADQLECFPSDLVNFLLARALSAVENGEWAIERRPYRYTIHWGQDGSIPVKRESKQTQQ